MSDSIRVLQLNCLNSGFEDRLQVIGNAILRANPDVGMLQEVRSLEAAKAMLAEKGYGYSVAKSFEMHGVQESVLIFSKTPLQALAFPVQFRTCTERTIAAVTEVRGKKALLFTIHSTWGGTVEGVRLKELQAIESSSERLAARSGASVTILGGDLNAEPDYRSIRFLAGRDVGTDGMTSAYWLDGWVQAGTSENEATTSPRTNELAAQVAATKGLLEPEKLPDRRIDYILTRGWNYGRAGDFESFKRLESPRGELVSDHYGLVAEVRL